MHNSQADYVNHIIVAHTSTGSEEDGTSPPVADTVGEVVAVAADLAADIAADTAADADFKVPEPKQVKRITRSIRKLKSEPDPEVSSVALTEVAEWPREPFEETEESSKKFAEKFKFKCERCSKHFSVPKYFRSEKGDSLGLVSHHLMTHSLERYPIETATI